MHENKHVSVWDWEQAHKLADFQTDAAKLLDVDWSLN